MDDGRWATYLPLIEESPYQTAQSRSRNSRSRDGCGAKIEIKSILFKSRLGVDGIGMESAIHRNRNASGNDCDVGEEGRQRVVCGLQTIRVVGKRERWIWKRDFKISYDFGKYLREIWRSRHWTFEMESEKACACRGNGDGDSLIRVLIRVKWYWS